MKTYENVLELLIVSKYEVTPKTAVEQGHEQTDLIICEKKKEDFSSVYE